MRFHCFEEAYIHILKEVYTSPEFENKPRGFQSKERLNCSFEIENPVDRVCFIPSRKENIVFNFAEVIWYLSGSDSLDFISYYADNMKKYSIDGKILSGTAYGAKIFNYGENNINQWDRLIEIFSEDVDSKRGFLQIFDANEDLHLRNIDVSCTIGLQFFIREGCLYTCSYMRANDAFRGIVSDIFSFTFIQEMLATQMGLKMGKFYHNVATVHVYEPDNENVEKVLLTSCESDKNKYQFPKMPAKDNWKDLHVVIKYEELLRKRKAVLTETLIDKLPIDNYWKQIVILFAIYQGIYYSKKVDCKLFYKLLPVYQYFIRNKWNSLVKEDSYGNIMESNRCN